MFEIRPYRCQDWSDICRVRDRARLDELLRYADLAAFVPLSHAPAEIERLQSAELWVAWDGQRVLGFVAIDGNRIEALHVDPEVNHPAIGRRLLRAALRQIPGTP
ncbi:MAG: GNAT family N-acetyltransferase, partial [Candidatus Bipolaricaulia bacterium]